MEKRSTISAKVEHARQVEMALEWLGWLVAGVGVAGMAVFTVFWVAGDLNAEQGVSLVLGTTLATVLSGVTAYGTGVNVGLGAERLQLAAREQVSARHLKVSPRWIARPAKARSSPPSPSTWRGGHVHFAAHSRILSPARTCTCRYEP